MQLVPTAAQTPDVLRDLLFRSLPEMEAIFTLEEQEGESRSLPEIRTMQAERFHSQLEHLWDNLHANLITLGWGMLQAEALELYRYIEGGNYQSMREWAMAISMDSAIYEKAILLGKAWPYLRELDLPIEVLVSPQFSAVKAQSVLRMQRDATRQIKAIEERYHGDTSGENENEEESEEQMRARAREEYRQVAKATIIDMVTGMPDKDVIAEDARRRGEKERPTIHLYLSYHQGQCTIRPSRFVCLPEHMEALCKGQVSILYYLDNDPDYLSAKALGERLLDLHAQEIMEDAASDETRIIESSITPAF